MSNNLLMGGLEELSILKKQVIELNNCIQQKDELKTLESQLEKGIEKKESEISDEINKVTHQRRVQMEKTIDEQIDSVNEKIKKVQVNKDKEKKKAVSQRINIETADHRSEAEELNIGGKSIFKQENIPFIYNNRLFFAIFFPRGIVDFGIIALTLIIAFFAIPVGIYYLLFNGMSAMFLALCYVFAIIIFGGAYIALGKAKCKHNETLDKVRDMRKKIQESKKEQKKIKKQIRKDKDESSYGLEEFDNELEKLQKSMNELSEQKKIALTDFDSTTSKSIKDQIDSSHEDELNGMKSEYKKVYQENKDNLDNLNKLSLLVTSEYEGYIGKEFLTLEKIEQMENSLRDGSAENIEQAVTLISKQIEV